MLFVFLCTLPVAQGGVLFDCDGYFGDISSQPALHRGGVVAVGSWPWGVVGFTPAGQRGFQDGERDSPGGDVATPCLEATQGRTESESKTRRMVGNLDFVGYKSKKSRVSLFYFSPPRVVVVVRSITCFFLKTLVVCFLWETKTCCFRWYYNLCTKKDSFEEGFLVGLPVMGRFFHGKPL